MPTTEVSVQESVSTTETIFTRAYQEHEKSLRSRSYFKVSDPSLADDLVQVTFLKTWEYLEGAGKIDSMKAFLFHVLNNLIIDEYRKQKTASLDMMTENGFQVAVEDAGYLCDEIDGRAALTLIPRLPAKYRTVLSMRFIEELTLREIAHLTGQSENTVVVQIRRGIEKLATLFRVDKAKNISTKKKNLNGNINHNKVSMS